MKLLFDFLPILLFFGVYRYAEGDKTWAADFATQHLGFLARGGQVGEAEAAVMLATAATIVATVLQVLYLKLRGRKVETMLWVSLTLIVVLGGLTIYFRNETFVKWKPSVLYWVMGLALWLAPLLFGRNLLRVLMGEQLKLPDRIWHRLNFLWVAFFAVMGLLNLWVAYNFPTATWVNFKMFGTLGLTLLFSLAQGLYLSRHLQPEADDGSQSPPSGHPVAATAGDASPPPRP